MSNIARAGRVCAIVLLAGRAGADPATWTPPVEVEAAEPAEEGVAPAGQDERDPAAFTTSLRPADAPGPLADPGDLLGTATGAYVRRAGGAGRGAQLVLRGAAPHQVAVFLDDIPLTGARGGAFDLSLLPASWLDRVDVVRGAAAAAYGSGAMGGAVHLRTRAPGPGGAGFAEVRAGSFGLRQIDGGYAHGGDGVDLLGAVSVSAAEGDFPFRDVNGRTRRRVNAGHARLAGLVRARADLGGAGALELLAEGLDDRRGEPGFEQFQRPETASATRRGSAAARWRHDRLAGGRLVAEGFVAGSVRRYVFVDDPLAEDGVYTGPAGAPRRYTADDRSVAGRARLAWAGSAWQLPSVAVDARHEAAETGVEGPEILARDRAERRLSTAVTFAEELYLAGDRLSLVGLLRLDDTDARAPILVPKVGAAWRLFDGVTLRANAGRIFRDPSFDELYFYGAGIAGNPNLRPEDGVAWDAGVRFELGRHLAVEGVWFEHRYDRLILFVQDSAFLIRARDDFGARVTGQEATVAVRWGGLSLDAACTRLDTAFDFAPHPPLPYRPAHRFVARAAQAVGPARVHVGFEGVGARTIDRFGRRKVDGYRFWDAGVGLALGGGLRAALEVRNVLDHRGALDAVQQPLPGRSYLFALRYDAAATRGDEGESR